MSIGIKRDRIKKSTQNLFEKAKESIFTGDEKS